MRIGISARSLAYESGGPTEYLVGLLDALFALDCRNDYILFYPDASYVGGYPRVEEIPLDTDNRLAFDWLRLPSALDRRGVDLAFFPSSNMPPRIPCKAVCAMLDLGYFFEEFRMYRLAETLYMRPMIKYAARRADHLLAISEATRQDVLARTAAPPERVTTVPLAADPVYAKPVAPGALEDFQKRCGLNRPFFLYAGNLSPRKNLDRLLQAYALALHRVDADLAVTGGRAWGGNWERRIAELGLEDRVKRLGHVRKEDMPLLYRSALALVFPSLFEGFGLPVLEAQACGLPVACSNATSLPEAAGDGAVFFDPRSIEAIRDALVAVGEDAALRAGLREKGAANEKRFSWKKTAEKTLEIFERVGKS